jgi:hypothetical protein
LIPPEKKYMIAKRNSMRIQKGLPTYRFLSVPH